jgi:hypothetical protein
MKSDRKFIGASVLSAFASFVFGMFFVLGTIIIFSRMPTGLNDLLPGITAGMIRILAACAAVFGMFGLLIARALVVLLQIEKSLRRRASGP